MFDVHLDPDEVPSRSYLVAKRFLLSIQPEYLIIGGDFGDFRSLCHHEKHKPLLRENRRYNRDIAIIREELEDLRDICPSATIDYLEGNHEKWAEKFVEENAPNMEGTINLPKDLDLDNLFVFWHPHNEVIKIGKLGFTHGNDATKYYAMRTLEYYTDNIMVGHAHRPQQFVLQKGSFIHPQPYTCVGVGCLCNKNPHYARNKRPEWAHGLGYVEYRENGEFQAHNINIVDGKLTFGGYTWEA